MKKFLFVLFIFASTFIAESEEINFSSDSMSGIAGSKTDKTILSGNAFVKTSTMQIKADSIELSGDDFRYITAEGQVEGSIYESKMDFTCGKLRYDRKTKIAKLEDSVHLVDNENDVTADAQFIEYDQNRETAIMQISISLKQKNNTCTSAFAIYRKAKQLLEMSGNPKIVQGQDSFSAQEITLNLKTQEITLDGRVKGSVTDSKKEEKKAATQNQENQAESEDSTDTADSNSADSKREERIPPEENKNIVADETTKSERTDKSEKNDKATAREQNDRGEKSNEGGKR
ncbi:LptA/OstA family protein [Treponema pectinovorum]|uniref:LptA/OstA family protein n=1 Tax=Treponema pectinovorum TaxID=164 RepID=UPI0011C8E9B6|nr:LptA/OstA family protein [Treponema pectinovorum]